MKANELLVFVDEPCTSEEVRNSLRWRLEDAGWMRESKSCDDGFVIAVFTKKEWEEMQK